MVNRFYVVKCNATFDYERDEYAPNDCYQVYDIKFDEDNNALFLIYENGEWRYEDAINFKPLIG